MTFLSWFMGKFQNPDCDYRADDSSLAELLTWALFSQGGGGVGVNETVAQIGRKMIGAAAN